MKKINSESFYSDNYKPSDTMFSEIEVSDDGSATIKSLPGMSHGDSPGVVSFNAKEVANFLNKAIREIESIGDDDLH